MSDSVKQILIGQRVLKAASGNLKTSILAIIQRKRVGKIFEWVA